MIVRVKGRGVKLSGRWYFKNQEAEIDEKEYEANIEYLDIIKGEKEDHELPQVTGLDDEEEKILNDLREKAKSLKIKNAHLMGKEKLEIAIAEAEAPMFGAKNDGDANVEDNNKGDSLEQNPQE